MADTKPSPLTAAELRAIGERVEQISHCERLTIQERDRANLYAAIDRMVCYDECIGRWYIAVGEDSPLFATKDAAIGALLQGGGE